MCVALAVTAAACGGSAPTQYDDQVERNFVDACTRTSGGMHDACARMYDCIKARVSFADFKAADAAVAAGTPVHPAVGQALAACAQRVR
ncbi:MAG TPA: hypothetical protein VE777_05335 [Gaiellales bacterium]|jgi:hypothetical protein|nr:hypothetical protein [Gaiellales bacterium]